jgi:type IV pilus assembly protein PilM
MPNQIVTGLDIGSSSIKAVMIRHDKGVPHLMGFGAVKTPLPGLLSDNDLDIEAVAKSISSLLSSLGAPLNSVVAALPESKIFSRVISEFPNLTDEELGSAIKYSAEEFVPLPTDQIELYWQVIERSKEKNQTIVLVIAVPKRVQGKYLKVLELSHIRLKALETEMIASTRVLVSNNVAVPTLLMDLGANSTDMAVVSNGVIMLTRSIATGGLTMSRALSSYLNLQPLQAEEYKKVYGLMEAEMQGRILSTLKPLVEILATEAQRTIQSFQSKHPQSLIKRLVLSGGGLVVYLANRTGLETQEADPWGFLQKDPSIASKVATDPSFTVAVGLGLRNE